MVYAFILSQELTFPVITMCHVLSVSRSSYYVYRKGGYTVESIAEKKVQAQVIGAFICHKRRYGTRRLVPELLDQGLKIGQCKVRRILREKGLKAIQPKSFVPRTTDSRHPYPISPNLLKGKAFPVRINQVWVGDIEVFGQQVGLALEFLEQPPVIDVDPDRLAGGVQVRTVDEENDLFARID